MPKKTKTPVKKKAAKKPAKRQEIKDSTITRKEVDNWEKVKKDFSNMNNSTLTSDEYRDYKKIGDEEGWGYKKGGKVAAKKKTKAKKK